MSYYINNTLQTVDGNRLSPDWAWEVAMVIYDENTGASNITVTYGYDTESYGVIISAPGDHTSNPDAYILTLPEFINSTGPIGSGGWPPPPAK